jgi:hypothetical protein
MNAHPSETSPTLRGKYIRERVLCETVPAPPPDVAVDLGGETEEARTLRERLERHRTDPACASCHAVIDPPGFLFENFDSSGAWRDDENGWPIDSSGELDGIELAWGRDLADLLPSDERVASCIVQQLYRHANGRLETPSERPALERLERALAASGYRFRMLLLALVTSEAFRTAAVDPEVSR